MQELTRSEASLATRTSCELELDLIKVNSNTIELTVSPSCHAFQTYSVLFSLPLTWAGEREEAKSVLKDCFVQFNNFSKSNNGCVLYFLGFLFEQLCMCVCVHLVGPLFTILGGIITRHFKRLRKSFRKRYSTDHKHT